MHKVGVSVVFLIWVVIGIFVAINHGYAVNGLHNFHQVINFLLAVLLWPLPLLGVNIHVT